MDINLLNKNGRLGVNKLAKVRQDAWSHEDDLLLAETVLRHIREGSTQLNAFEEVGDQLNRTSAACGFRWNAEVRQNYEQAISIAKRQRKQKKRALTKGDLSNNPNININLPEKSKEVERIFSTSKPDLGQTDNGHLATLSLDQVIGYLKGLKKDINRTDQTNQSLTSLEQEHKRVIEQNQQLKKNVKKLEIQLENVQEDYQTFLQIMDRARKMVVFNDEDDSNSPAFIMEKNGNLEQVAR